MTSLPTKDYIAKHGIPQITPRWATAIVFAVECYYVLQREHLDDGGFIATIRDYTNEQLRQHSYDPLTNREFKILNFVVRDAYAWTVDYLETERSRGWVVE